ncbi:uncharacterized protein BYT42DRAFT_483554, partial [Radiomyces spectabilis]|uniref:uncharacterized protein n=1 Tax=Radiomyces spectabilis TaxID=64574 RepID=UPI00222001B9
PEIIIVLATVLGTSTTAQLPFWDHAMERFILTWKFCLVLKIRLLMKTRIFF